MIHLRPVTPDEAGGAVRDVFEQLRLRLALPWVPAMYQAFAMYPTFLELAWDAIAPRVRAPVFLDEAEQVRRVAVAWGAWYRPVFRWEGGDPGAVASVLDAFLHGNAKLAIIASAYLLGLEGGRAQRIPVGALSDLRPDEELVAATRIRLTPPDEAPPRLKATYRDIERTLGMPLVATDYQAVGTFPGALECAWPDLRVALGQAEYRAAEEQLSVRIDQAAQRVGLARSMDRMSIRMVARMGPAEVANLSALIHMFRRLMPGLCLQVAMLRRAFAMQALV